MKKIVILLLHIGYWIMYLFVLLFILIAFANGEKHLTLEKVFINLFWSPFAVFALFPGIIGFYTFYSLLFDFLTKKKILKFFISAIAVSILSATLTLALMALIFGNKIRLDINTIIFGGLFIAFLVLVHGIIGLVMRGFITWYNDIKIKVELNKKNHEMELELIRAHLNPHFLFNTINNIDVLIQKDTIKASDYLNKLSDILRFMLYETKTEKIFLEKELSYIEKYLDLQKIRTSNQEYVNYHVKGKTENVLITPMLFMPFIENAFKHAENKKTENAINICIFIEKDTLRFECENNYSAASIKKPDHSGLGNELIKKRLQLLYPNKHTLETTDNNNTYKVKLVLNVH